MPASEHISVIVPVYNVRRYLRQCLESLSAQDYPSFEVILVDDGSTDGSGTLCDEYASKNRCFRVVHQQNEGLSAARNKGLSFARGQYISFVDSDDWVSRYYLSMLMSAVERTGMPCASLAHLKPFRDGHDCRLHDGRESQPVRIGGKNVQVMDEVAIQKALLRQRINCGAQARLCRRDVLFDAAVDGKVFPENLLYEDLATVYRFIHEAGGSALVHGNLYAYRRRRSGIMGNLDALHDEKTKSAIQVSRGLYENMLRWHPELGKETASRCLALLCTVYASLGRCEQDNERALWQEIQRYSALVRDDAGARLKDRTAAYCVMSGERIFAMFCRLYRGHYRWIGF